MKYMGSKQRFAKDLLKIILKDRKDEQWYVEPFAGGMNVICDVQGNRIANDINRYLISMWKGLVQGREIIYNDISKEIYDKARYEFYKNTNIEFDDFTIGWIGWMGSANGRFFDGGYSGKSFTKIGTVRDYIQESINNIKKQIPKMNGVIFESKNYHEIDIPKNSIIYCDIPYNGTKQYCFSKNFDYQKFWGWARKLFYDGHQVFISEYSAPYDFECIWEKEAKSSLSANNICGGNKNSIERLFKHKP